MKKDVRTMLMVIGITVIVAALGLVYLVNTYATSPADEGLRATLAEAKTAYDAGEAYMVDVRTQSEYDALRIPGAHLMPFQDMEGNEPPVEKGVLIYLYCT